MDSVATAKDISDLLRNPACWIFFIWVAREGYHAWQKKGQAMDLLLKECTSKMAELTIAIVRLETKIEAIEPVIYSVPKMEKDISALHRKFREGQ